MSEIPGETPGFTPFYPLRLRKWGPCRFAALPRLSEPPPQGAHDPCRLSTLYPHSIHILSTFYPHSIHILSTFYPHSIHNLSTIPIAHAVCPAPRKVARSSRDKGRDGCHPLCACCQFVSCWWAARGRMCVVLLVVGGCWVLLAPSMASGW